MLRLLVVAFGVALAAAGIWLWLLGIKGPAIYLMLSGGAILLGTVFERWRYRKEPPVNARWQVTGERFVDPQSGADVDVLYDPDSGERRYESSGPGRNPPGA
jgi:uncharacterized membrane-anchored protein